MHSTKLESLFDASRREQSELFIVFVELCPTTDRYSSVELASGGLPEVYFQAFLVFFYQLKTL